MKQLHQILKPLVKTVAWFRTAFADKAVVESDQCEVEHLLLYHGLTGSRPEHERQFKDVRQDVEDSIKAKSALSLSIALKLYPLWWEDRLRSIFAELESKYSSDILSLLVSGCEQKAEAENFCPLFYKDWKSRANAANVLAQFNARAYLPQLIASLQDSAVSTQPAFCHISYALGSFDCSQAYEGILPYLSSENAWFRVDAARALVRMLSVIRAGDQDDTNKASANKTDGKLCVEELEKTLAKGLLDRHVLSDYSASTIAKGVSMQSWLGSKDLLLSEAACEAISLIVRSAQEEANQDIVESCHLHSLLPTLIDKCTQEDSRTVRMLLALHYLLLWWQDMLDMRGTSFAMDVLGASYKEIFDSAQSILTVQNASPLIVSMLAEPDKKAIEAISFDQAAAIELIGELPAVDLAKYLLPFLSLNSKYLDEALVASKHISDTNLSQAIVRLVSELVDLDNRCQRVKSAIPVFEDNPQAAKSYWLALKALSAQNGPEVYDLLLKCLDDFAPDKREVALESLMSIVSHDQPTQILKVKVMDMLNDGYVPAKLQAIRAVGVLNDPDMISYLLPLLNAKEASVSREAAISLEILAGSGHKAAVVTALEIALKSTKDVYLHDKLNVLLRGVQSIA